MRRPARTASIARRSPDAHADPQQRVARAGHDRAHVGEVEVDQPRQRDQVRDALDALAQDVVGDAERLDHRGVALEHGEQPVVGDDDQRVDLVGERRDSGLGLHAAPRALELERAGDDPDRQRAELAGDLGDDRSGTGAGPAARAGRDEDHVRPSQQRLDAVVLLARGLAAEIGVRARAEAAGHRIADVQGLVGRGLLQRLQVGVDRDELDALDLGLDHAVDGVDAGAADADHGQDRARGTPRCHPPAAWRTRRAPAVARAPRAQPARSRGCRPRRRGAAAPGETGCGARAPPAALGGGGACACGRRAAGCDAWAPRGATARLARLRLGVCAAGSLPG